MLADGKNENCLNLVAMFIALTCINVFDKMISWNLIKPT